MTVKLYNGGEVVPCKVHKEFYRNVGRNKETYVELSYKDPIAGYEKRARYPLYRTRGYKKFTL